MKKILFPLIFIYCCDLIIKPEKEEAENKESDHIAELIFLDDFNTSDQILSSYSSYWDYNSEHYSVIAISNNKLIIEGINDAYAHRIWDYILTDTKLIDKIEFSADMGLVNYSFDSGQAIYGIFLRDGKDEKVYHFYLEAESNNNLSAVIRYFDFMTYEWSLEPLYKVTLSTSVYNIDNINIKMIYDVEDDYKLKYYLNNTEIFSRGQAGFECRGYGIYTQNSYAIWVDNVGIYGKETSLSRGNSIRPIKQAL